MGRDKDLYLQGKAAAKALKNGSITPGPAASGRRPSSSASRSSTSPSGSRRNSLDGAAGAGRKQLQRGPASRPPPASANRRWTADVQTYANVQGSGSPDGYNYGQNGLAHHHHLAGGYDNDEDADYVEHDLAALSAQRAAMADGGMPRSATSPGPYFPPPSPIRQSYGGRPPSSAGSHGGAGVGAGGMYDAAPPPPPFARHNSMEIGSVYSHGSANNVGYGPYGFYAEAPAYSTPGGWTSNPSHYGHDYAVSPHPESIVSGHTLYSAQGPDYNAYGPYPPSGHDDGSSYPDLYSTSGQGDLPPHAIFGVAAPHHSPGRGSFATRGGDLPGFPSWTPNWYGGHVSADGHAYTTVQPNASASGWESETLTNSSAAGHHHHQSGHPRMGGYGRPNGRNGATMDDFVKEERMRMLEKEFGPKVRHKGEKGDDSDDDELKPEEEEAMLPIGSILRNGKIKRSWPRIVTATRVLQVLLSLITLLVGVGGALLIKSGDEKPPPKGTIPSFVLYGVAAISTLLLVYLFVFRPCCCDPMRKLNRPGPGGANNMAGLMAGGGGMVIPVMGGAGGKKAGGGMFGGKKNKKMGGGMAPTVNLIVDPSMLGGGKNNHDDDDDSFDSDDDEDLLPGEQRRKRRKRRRRNKRANKLELMKLNAKWTFARRFIKVLLAWDCIMTIIWIAADVLVVGVGKKCPSGSSNGWCDWYNGAIACAFLTTVTFLVAIWWDIADLRSTKNGPRPGEETAI